MMEFGVTPVRLDYLALMVYLENVEVQGREVHKDQVAPKETMDIKAFLARQVSQDFLGSKEKVDFLVKWDLRVRKESLVWMVQRGQSDHLDFKGQKEILALLVHQALQVKVFPVILVLSDLGGKKAYQDPKD